MAHTFSPQTSPLSNHDPVPIYMTTLSSIKPSSSIEVPLRAWSPTMTNDEHESTDSESAETESAKFFHNASAFSNSRGSTPGTCSPATYSGFSEVDSSTSPENLQRRRSNSAPLMSSLPPSVDGMMTDGSTWTPQSPFSSRYFAGSLPSKETQSSSVPSSPNNIECWQTDTTNGSTGVTTSSALSLFQPCLYRLIHILTHLLTVFHSFPNSFLSGTSGSAYVSRQPWPACTSQKRFQPTGITTFGTGDCTRITTRFGSFDHVSRWFGPCYFPRTRAGTRTRASARTNGNGRRSFESYFGPIAVVPSGSPGSSTPT